MHVSVWARLGTCVVVVTFLRLACVCKTMDNLATFMTRPVFTIGDNDDERLLITAWYVQYASAYAQRLQTNMYGFLAMKPHQHVGEFFEFVEKPCFVTRAAVPKVFLNFFAFKIPETLDAYPCMSADSIHITETDDETASSDKEFNTTMSVAAQQVYDNGLYFECDENGDIVEPFI